MKALILALVALLICASAHAAQIELTPATKDAPPVISVIGDISTGDDEKFGKIAAANSGAVVLLDSNGGLIDPAMAIGRIIRLREYSTFVYKDNTCASACALIWLAGSRRVIFDNGKVGFHASYQSIDGRPLEIGVANALIGHYLSQLGYGERTVIFATTAAPDKILWLDGTNSEMSGIEYQSMSSDADSRRSATTSTPAPGSDSSEQLALDSTAEVGRTVKYFADGLRQTGYKAEINTSDLSSPRIFTGVNGDKMGLIFSGCDGNGCNYVEIAAAIEGVKESSAEFIVRKYYSEERYSSYFYDSKAGDLYIYHYVVIGQQGISSKNLIENVEYFDREFEEVSRVIGQQ